MEARADRVDAHEPERAGLARRGEHLAHELAGGGLLPGATASSRSATTASAADASALTSLRSSLPGAKRRERTRERSVAVAQLYVRHSAPVNLTAAAKSDINASLSRRAVSQEVESMKAVVFHEFGGVDVLQRGRPPRPGARSRPGADRHHRVRAQPPRRRRPRGRLALPGRASLRARRRGRRPDRRARRGRRRLERGRPRDAAAHGHVRRVPLLPHRPGVALHGGRVHQLRHHGRLCRAARLLGQAARAHPGRGRRRGRGGDSDRVRHRVAHALHARPSRSSARR